MYIYVYICAYVLTPFLIRQYLARAVFTHCVPTADEAAR